VLTVGAPPDTVPLSPEVLFERLSSVSPGIRLKPPF
jgi:hypothetical protein